MARNLIERIALLINEGGMSRSGLARAAGLHANTLRDCGEPHWNPTAETLGKLERFLLSNDDRRVLVPIEEIIDEARNGRMFILVDDEDRENEGDLIIPAQMATPDAITFMATHGRGLICLCLTRDRCEQLEIPPMVRNNGTPLGTAFTVSIEAREGITTGISAADRARTVSVAIDGTKGKADLVSPGHVFPLQAKDGGVLVRTGHTEAGIDISRLAGLNPSAVICEVMKDDGEMARLDDLVSFARLHDLKIGTIRDLIEYRRRNDHLVECVSESPFFSDYGGEWIAKSYRNKIDGTAHVVLQKGKVVSGEPTLVRVHGISIFSDVLGAPGPRKRILQRSMEAIGRSGAGVIVLIMPTEGAALVKEIGSSAEHAPAMDLRDYGIGAQILADLGIHDMILLTNAHRNIVALEGYDLNIVGEMAISE